MPNKADITLLRVYSLLSQEKWHGASYLASLYQRKFGEEISKAKVREVLLWLHRNGYILARKRSRRTGKIWTFSLHPKEGSEGEPLDN